MYIYTRIYILPQFAYHNLANLFATWLLCFCGCHSDSASTADAYKENVVFVDD